MNSKEIANAIADLCRATNTLEELYIENGGEVTEEAAEKEEQIESIKALLTGEGIDSLGRWLAWKEHEKAMLKAEKAALDRHIKAVDGTIDYIKYQVGQVLRATGCEKAKGLAYSFSQATSTKNSVNQEALDAAYLERAEAALRHALIPEYVHITLKATTTELNAAGGDALGFIETTTTETCRFTKPRAAKEDKKDE
jgi:hypothetical protein